MGKWDSVRDSLHLLSRRDRFRLGAVVALQSSLGILDLLAVALLGVVALLTAGAATNDVPAQLEQPIEWLGLADVPLLNLTITLAAIAGLLMVAKSVTSFLVARRIFRFLANRQAEISSRLSGVLLARPLLDIQERSSQDIAFALTIGVNALTLGVLGQATILISEITLMVVLSAGLLIIDPLVTLFTVIFFGTVAFGLLRVLSSQATRLGQRNAATQIASVESIQDVLRSYREVTVSGRRDMYADQFQKLRWTYAQVQASTYVISQASKYVFEIALIFGAAGLAYVQFVTKDLLAAVGTLAVFLAAVSRIMPSLLRLQSAAMSIRNQSGVAEPTLALAHELRDGQSATLDDLPVDATLTQRVVQGIQDGHEHFDNSITCRDLVLTYPGADRPAIDHVSLEVPSSTSIAFVGSTGAGKSTLADLILGIIRPDSGDVQVSGVPPAEAVLAWPGASAYVAQETALVNGDIRSNVALGLSPELVEDDRVWEALERARLSEFIAQQPEGLETPIGENGMRLSGGQRQRLGLARALYTRPALLVLDEATSALDAETEDAVTKTLQDLGQSVTLVVVAHRLATIRELDQVAYLEQGRLVALGSFEEVRREVPAFERQAGLLGL